MRLLLALAALLPIAVHASDYVSVAVASNFSRTATELGAQFTAASGIPVRISNGSTGKLYAQIVNGAPFDVFLAADAQRPALLEASGAGVAGSRFTYAIGELVLWSRGESDCYAALHGAGHVALANPETAPYGLAARAFLVDIGLWDSVAPRAVYGENIAQTLQFVATGNASVGFIARSQLHDPRLPAGTCSWDLPATTGRHMEQQAVLLVAAADNPGAARFMAFLKSDAARALIQRNGYGVGE